MKFKIEITDSREEVSQVLKDISFMLWSLKDEDLKEGVFTQYKDVDVAWIEDPP